MSCKKDLFVRYLVFIFGIYLLAWGVVLIVRSALGTTPISCVNYVASMHTPLSLGTCTFIINMILIGVQLWLVRGRRTRRDVMEIGLQVPFSFVFAAFIDFNMALSRDLVPAGYAMSLAILALGCVVQALGVVFEIKPHVAMMSGEAVVKYASQRYGREFGRLKVVFDCTLVCTAIALSLLLCGRVEGVREGTVVAAAATGYIVTFLNARVLTRRNLSRTVSALAILTGGRRN